MLGKIHLVEISISRTRNWRVETKIDAANAEHWRISSAISSGGRMIHARNSRDAHKKRD
jgi:hypothetical protein